MKFTIPSKVLLSHLSAVSKVVSQKSSIAILDNFLFTLKDNMLIVKGTDTENTITARIDLLESEGEGSVAVNVKRMLDLLKELNDEALQFEIDDNTFEIHLQYHNGDYNFVGVNGADYPKKEVVEDDALEMVVSAEEITKGIEKTIFAVGTDPMRPIMMGVLWDIKPDSIVFVGSDIHKLVRYINNRIAPGIEGSFVLPSKPANILSGILSKEGGDVKIVMNSKTVLFETAGYTIECSYINGKYPNYNAAIPQNNPYEIIVDRTVLLNAIRRVAVFATEVGLVQFEISEGKIFVKSQDLEYSTSAKECIDCDYSGDPLSLGFNKDKIIEVLSNVKGDNVILRMSGAGRAGLFLPMEQEKDEEWLALLMPMRVANM